MNTRTSILAMCLLLSFLSSGFAQDSRGQVSQQYRPMMAKAIHSNDEEVVKAAHLLKSKGMLSFFSGNSEDKEKARELVTLYIKEAVRIRYVDLRVNANTIITEFKIKKIVCEDRYIRVYVKAMNQVSVVAVDKETWSVVHSNMPTEYEVYAPY